MNLIHSSSYWRIPDRWIRGVYRGSPAYGSGVRPERESDVGRQPPGLSGNQPTSKTNLTTRKGEASLRTDGNGCPSVTDAKHTSEDQHRWTGGIQTGPPISVRLPAVTISREPRHEVKQTELAQRFGRGDTHGTASNMAIRTTTDGTEVIGYGWAIYARRDDATGRVTLFDGWYGYSQSTNRHLNVLRPYADDVSARSPKSADSPTYQRRTYA